MSISKLGEGSYFIVYEPSFSVTIAVYDPLVANQAMAIDLGEERLEPVEYGVSDEPPATDSPFVPLSEAPA